VAQVQVGWVTVTVRRPLDRRERTGASAAGGPEQTENRKQKEQRTRPPAKIAVLVVPY
jgi:hypothetical protein